MSLDLSQDLAGRVAIVTGAGGGGSGHAIATALADRGVSVSVNGLPRHEAALHEMCLAFPGLTAAIADVSAEQEVEAMVSDTVSRHGRLDIIVHNAAEALPHQDIADMSTAAWRANLATILDGAFFLSRAVVPHMRKTGYGRLIFVSSSAAFRGTWGRSAGYAAAKAGLHGVVVQLALELGPAGITANAVAPSQIDSPRVRRGGRRTADSLRASAQSIPLRRIGQPADLAGAVCFLASAAGSYMTGQVLRLDGGSSLAGTATETIKEQGS